MGSQSPIERLSPRQYHRESRVQLPMVGRSWPLDRAYTTRQIGCGVALGFSLLVGTGVFPLSNVGGKSARPSSEFHLNKGSGAGRHMDISTSLMSVPSLRGARRGLKHNFKRGPAEIRVVQDNAVGARTTFSAIMDDAHFVRTTIWTTFSSVFCNRNSFKMTSNSCPSFFSSSKSACFSCPSLFSSSRIACFCFWIAPGVLCNPLKKTTRHTWACRCLVLPLT